MMVGELADNDQEVVSTTMLPIPGLASDWESCRATRALLRESGSIVHSEPGKYHASDTVMGVGANLTTLLPLMPRLWQPVQDANDGSVGMVSVPALEEQFLCFALCVFEIFLKPTSKQDPLFTLHNFPQFPCCIFPPSMGT